MTTAETKSDNKPKKATASGGVPQKAGKSAKASKPKTLKGKVSKTVAGAVQGRTSDSRVTLRIRVRAYESKILDASVKQIMDTAVRYDAEIIGPAPLPTE